MRSSPERLVRLPEQYFGALLTRVSVAVADKGEPLIDLGRGNPETGPPDHVIEALAQAARNQDCDRRALARSRGGRANRRPPRSPLPGLPVRAGAGRWARGLCSSTVGTSLDAGFRGGATAKRSGCLPELPF